MDLLDIAKAKAIFGGSSGGSSDGGNVMVVHYEFDEQTMKVTGCDKTLAEINEAYASGALIVADVAGITLLTAEIAPLIVTYERIISQQSGSGFLVVAVPKLAHYEDSGAEVYEFRVEEKRLTSNDK